MHGQRYCFHAAAVSLAAAAVERGVAIQGFSPIAVTGDPTR